MGHERLGVLPKTEKWREIVRRISTLYSSDDEIADIAGMTFQNLSQRYRKISYDSGVQAAFTFLVLIAVASESDDPRSELAKQKIELSGCPNLFELVKAADIYIANEKQSLEYSELARSAATDAITNWYKRNRTVQLQLFQKDEKFFESWKKAGSGAGFCELARLFFGNLTERYLKYFLEREASGVLANADERELFERELSQHISSISRHAFETAKITQSFAAGWYNKNAKGGVPSNESIRGFMSVAFNKMSEELERGRHDS